MKQFPAEMAEGDRKKLIDFLSPRFDANLAKLLFGNTIKVLNVDETFSRRDSTACWYLRQVFINMALKVLELVKIEKAMNPDANWEKKAPSHWKLDKNMRDGINTFFDSMCVAPNFKNVELGKFSWNPLPVSDHLNP